MAATVSFLCKKPLEGFTGKLFVGETVNVLRV
jgi:hypothetical protein